MSEADVGMAVFRNQFGVLMHVARAQLDQENRHAVLLSEVTRELSRDLGTDGARRMLQQAAEAVV
jgi:hypothetical protein